MTRVCLDCTTAYAVGAPRCPHCGSERGADEGSAAALGVYAGARIEEEDMPKITRHGGPSTAPADEPVDAAEGAEESPAESNAEAASEESEKAPRRRTRSK